MPRRPLILASLLLASFAINLDTTIVNVALPTLVRALHASTTQLEWIVDAYNLVFAALVLASGNLSDRLRRKGVLLAGLGIFGAATVAGGLGGSLGELIRFTWSSVFFALAPIAALAAALVAISVPTSRDPQAPPADRAGLVLSTAAMALLIYTIIEAPERGWSAPRSVAGFALAGALLVAFVAWERRVRAPMLDVGLFGTCGSARRAAR
jgi:MFS family permease